MSFITRSSRGISTAAVNTAEARSLTSSGAIRIIDKTHLVHVPVLGGMLLDLAATDPAALVLHMQAQGRYVLDAIVMHDLRGTPGDVTVTIRTLDASRGGGVLLVDQQPLAALATRHALIRVVPAEDAIWEVPHLYITLAGTGSGTVLVRALGTVVAPEDPEHPMCDPRRLG
ncbi:hypothetical protein [Paracoccus sp. J55]|uniref:hypothetical protein n=1 Tax=Paracoccus sp. J55 TaxID=935849 RepID=UPI00048DE11A|nr:hypothetical protein [Paracoccus sp. J55]